MKEQSKTHLITTIILASITVAITVVLVISIKFSTKRKRFNYPRSRNIEPKVIEDDQFIKPNAKLNAKFKMLKLGNGMKTLLISDPYAKYAHIQISMNYGSNYDTLPGFCHFGEHMILQGSENLFMLLWQHFMGSKVVKLTLSQGQRFKVIILDYQIILIMKKLLIY